MNRPWSFMRSRGSSRRESAFRATQELNSIYKLNYDYDVTTHCNYIYQYN